METNKNKYWIVYVVSSSLTILFCGFFTLISWYEWFTVGVAGNTDGYPFGGEGPTPYYYKSADLYSTVMFIWGLIFLVVLSFGTWTLIKRQRKSSLLAFGLTLLLTVVLLIHGQIGT